ncbi:MAG TPA: nuclear transport factor 2 family protein [Pyrinomonadaceae bacterium]|nr:nuclear transport factor 2 family protein [Pyrinomonadaceae bacterium]
MAASTVDELTKIEHELAAAWVAGDHSFHERILSDDWSVIDPSGRVLTKAEVLNEAFTGERSITEGEIDQINVRDFGDWAVVTGRTRMSGSYQGEEMKVTLRFMDVFDRSSGEWRCVASQGTMAGE